MLYCDVSMNYRSKRKSHLPSLMIKLQDYMTIDAWSNLPLPQMYGSFNLKYCLVIIQSTIILLIPPTFKRQKSWKFEASSNIYENILQLCMWEIQENTVILCLTHIQFFVWYNVTVSPVAIHQGYIWILAVYELKEDSSGTI